MSSFNINNIYNLSSAQVRSGVNSLKSGNKEERELYEFILKKADTDKDGKVDMNEFAVFLSKIDKKNDKGTANDKISDAELEKFFGKNTTSRGVFKELLKGFEDLLKGNDVNAAQNKPDNLKKDLQGFLNSTNNNTLKELGKNGKYGDVKENSSTPKKTFNGIEYAKSMNVTDSKGNKAVVYYDSVGNVIGYNVVKTNKDGTKIKTSYGAEGHMLAITAYDKEGKKTKRTTYDLNGTLASESSYDKDGNLKARTNYQADGKTVKSKVKYDKDGNRTEAKYYDTDGKTLKRKVEYDKDGHKASAEVYGYTADGKRYVKEKIEFTTDKDGMVTGKKGVTFDENGNKVSEYDAKCGENGKVSEKNGTTFDEGGNAVSTYITKYDENGKVESKAGTTLDIKGNPTGHYNIVHNDDGTKTKTLYDAAGRATSEKTTKDGKVLSEKFYSVGPEGSYVQKEIEYNENGDKIIITRNPDGSIASTIIEHADGTTTEE